MRIFFFTWWQQEMFAETDSVWILIFYCRYALKSLDFVSALIKHGLSLLHETLWQVFCLPSMLVVGVLKSWWLWSSLPLFLLVTWMKASFFNFVRHWGKHSYSAYWLQVEASYHIVQGRILSPLLPTCFLAMPPYHSFLLSRKEKCSEQDVQSACL